jgi:hypothetical protein
MKHRFHRYRNKSLLLQRRAYLAVAQKRQFSIVACVFFAAGMCLLRSCLAMDICSGSTIPAFSRHVTVYTNYMLNIVCKSTISLHSCQWYEPLMLYLTNGNYHRQALQENNIFFPKK